MVAEEHITYRFEGRVEGLTIDVVTPKELPVIDPLTSSYFDVWRVLHSRGEQNFGCTCGWKPGQIHRETCDVTPIFAKVCYWLARPSEIRAPIVAEAMMIRHRMKTEDECGMCSGDCEDYECPLFREDDDG